VSTSSTTQAPSAMELRTVLSSAPRPRTTSPLAATVSFAWRGMLKVKHVPEQLMGATVIPVLWVLMFTYLFGGAIAGSTGAYRDYLLPAMLVVSILFITPFSGVALNTDITRGVVDRFRSLPISRTAPLLGSLLGDSARYLVSGIVVIVLGLILGFRPDAGGVLAALGLVVAFAFGLSWAFAALGLVLRAPDAVLMAGQTGVIFPLVFLSNAFVEPETLPAGLEAIAKANPISVLATASRGLMEGDAAGGDIAIVLAIAVGLTAVFAPLTTRLYHRRA
jgi:daunorubicin/doxorubicin transport system permease protein